MSLVGYRHSDSDIRSFPIHEKLLIHPRHHEYPLYTNTSFPRRCNLTDFNCTLAAMDILFINISRRFTSSDSGRAALDFNAFVEMLLTISQRGLSIQKRQPIDNLRYILRHSEMHLEKSMCRTQHIAKLPMSPLIRRPLKSSFVSLPATPAL